MIYDKKILITLGDPAGVGTEVALKAFDRLSNTHAIILIGHFNVVYECIKLLNLSLEINEIDSPDEALFNQKTVNLISLGITEFEKRRSSSHGGKTCVSYIEKAVQLLLKKKAHALVTAPISKESLKLAKIDFPGHTELISHLTNTDEYAMMLCGGQLRVVLTTIHTPIIKVPSLIKKKQVLKTIRLAKKAAKMLQINNPRIAVAGLNPHAGESGIFGKEEIDEIMPAIEISNKEGDIFIPPPYPPDTIFYKAYNGQIDIIVVMYHDQGLIPLKMIAFDSGVNITVGLPIIRTSPDHGTAYNIAWYGVASPNSMIESIKMACKLEN